jgi:predicted transcriptional regulator
MDKSESPDLVGLTAQIVSAYVAKNAVAAGELAGLIGEVHVALARAAGGVAAEEPQTDELRPAVPIKKSVTDEYIICLEDGKRFKSLKRHLRTHYKLSPDQYRAKWKLPPTYPMVAPNYAAARSQLAKKMGLGTRRDGDA